MGFPGKEKADGLAQRAVQFPPANHYTLPLQNYVPQSRSDQRVVDGNKLAQLRPFFGPWSSCSQRCRRLEVSLSRLRIDHTRLTRGLLMALEAPPVCDRLSVFHVLVECPVIGFSLP